MIKELKDDCKEKSEKLQLLGQQIRATLPQAIICKKALPGPSPVSLGSQKIAQGRGDDEDPDKVVDLASACELGFVTSKKRSKPKEKALNLIGDDK